MAGIEPGPFGPQADTALYPLSHTGRGSVVLIFRNCSDCVRPKIVGKAPDCPPIVWSEDSALPPRAAAGFLPGGQGSTACARGLGERRWSRDGALLSPRSAEGRRGLSSLGIAVPWCSGWGETRLCVRLGGQLQGHVLLAPSTLSPPSGSVGLRLTRVPLARSCLHLGRPSTPADKEDLQGRSPWCPGVPGDE